MRTSRRARGGSVVDGSSGMVASLSKEGMRSPRLAPLTPPAAAAVFLLAACSAPHPSARAVPAVPGSIEPTDASSPKPAAPALRLPDGVRPTRYAAELTLDPRAPHFSGRVTIELDVVRPTRVIWINATDLSIASATVRSGASTESAEVVAADDDFTRVTAPHTLPAGPATLTLIYQGALDATRSRGLYREKEKEEWYVYSFFEPLDARRAFPSFDEPDFKVPWAITLHVPAGNVALTNSPAIREREEPGGMKEVVFAESKPMPTYAVALVVGPFDLVERPDGPKGKPLRIAVPRGRGEEARYAAEHTSELVRLLEDYFGMPYPYDKLDVAVVPRYWGTMEHPGLVALGQPLTLIRPDEETEQRREHYANIAVHELAHYWFGDYVTMRWWDDTWLNEAFGAWLDEKMTDAFAPRWEFPLARLGMTEWSMREDAVATAKAVRQPIATRNDIGASFDNGMTYGKGGAVVRMVEHWLGAPRFQAVVRRYMQKFAWRNASSEDFYALLEAEQPGATAVMRSFVEQPGLPRVSAKLTCEAGKEPRVTLAQSRFLPWTKTESVATWSIPVCLRYPTGAPPGSASTCVLLDKETATAPLPGVRGCPAWFDANDDASGYYRVRYEEDAFRRMITAEAGPSSSGLTTRERIALLGDQRALVAAGEASPTSLLSVLPGLAAARDVKVARAAARFVESIHAHLDPALRAPFGRFVRATFGPRARALGWVDRPGDGQDTRDMRRELVPFVAVEGGDAALAAEARRLALAWLGDRSALRGETVPAVLASAVATGDRAIFGRVVDEAQRTGDRRERSVLLEALGAARDPALAGAALELVAGDRVDLRESRSILTMMAWAPETRDMAFTFLLSHFDALAARLRDDEAGGLLSVVDAACDEPHRARAESGLAERASKLEGGTQALRNALGAVQSCQATVAVMRPALATFFRTR
jgi:aminopeptidase N